MTDLEIKDLLDYWAKEVEENGFLEHDPVQIPHRYSRLQDVEIAGFLRRLWLGDNAKRLSRVLRNSCF